MRQLIWLPGCSDAALQRFYITICHRVLGDIDGIRRLHKSSQEFQRCHFISFLPLKLSRSSTRLGSIVDDPSVDWFSPFFCLRREIPRTFCIQEYVAIILRWYLIRYHCISFVSYFPTFRLCGKAQNFLHLLVETLEQHALADASVERSRWRTPCAREGRAPLLRARLADLMAMLLWKLSCKLHKVQLQNMVITMQLQESYIISLHIWRDLNAWDLMVMAHDCT